MMRSINSFVDGVIDEPTCEAVGDGAPSRTLHIDDRNWTDCDSLTSASFNNRRRMPTDDSSPAEPPLLALAGQDGVLGPAARSDCGDAHPPCSAGSDGTGGVPPATAAADAVAAWPPRLPVLLVTGPDVAVPVVVSRRMTLPRGGGSGAAEQTEDAGPDATADSQPLGATRP